MDGEIMSGVLVCGVGPGVDDEKSACEQSDLMDVALRGDHLQRVSCSIVHKCPYCQFRFLTHEKNGQILRLGRDQGDEDDGSALRWSLVESQNARCPVQNRQGTFCPNGCCQKQRPLPVVVSQNPEHTKRLARAVTTWFVRSVARVIDVRLCQHANAQFSSPGWTRAPPALSMIPKGTFDHLVEAGLDLDMVSPETQTDKQVMARNLIKSLDDSLATLVTPILDIHFIPVLSNLILVLAGFQFLLPSSRPSPKTMYNTSAYGRHGDY